MTNDERLEQARNEVIEAAKKWAKGGECAVALLGNVRSAAQELTAIEQELADPVKVFLVYCRANWGTLTSTAFMRKLEAAERHLELMESVNRLAKEKK